MKFLIVSIAVLCVAVNANPIEESTEKNPFAVNLAKYIRDYVEKWAKTIPGWDIEGSIEKNLVNLTTHHFEGDIFPAWNLELSAKQNIENILDSLENKDFNQGATLNENIKMIVGHIVTVLPIPSIFPINEMTLKIQDFLRKFIADNLFKSDSALEKLGQAVDDWVKSLDDIDGQSPAVAISHTLRHVFTQLNIPGCTADKTIQDNAFAFAESIFANGL